MVVLYFLIELLDFLILLRTRNRKFDLSFLQGCVGCTDFRCILQNILFYFKIQCKNLNIFTASNDGYKIRNIKIILLIITAILNDSWNSYYQEIKKLYSNLSYFIGFLIKSKLFCYSHHHQRTDEKGIHYCQWDATSI